MKKLIFLFPILFCFSACLRLNSNLFNGDNTITAYKLDAFKNEIVPLDSSYFIPDSLIHLFTIESDDNGDKAKIYAVYIGDTNKIATDTVILYSHGNAAYMDIYWTRAKLLAHVGGKNRYGVLMYDYRGYGLSEKHSTENSMYADADACCKWLKVKGLTDARFVMYGFSLGTAPTCELTAHKRTLSPQRFILEAPFASTEEMVQDAGLLNMPASFFTDNKIDNAGKIRDIEQPFMWIHGTSDSFLSLATHGQVVYDNYKGAYKEAHKIEGAEHSTIPPVWGYKNYLAEMEAFMVH